MKTKPFWAWICLISAAVMLSACEGESAPPIETQDTGSDSGTNTALDTSSLDDLDSGSGAETDTSTGTVLDTGSDTIGVDTESGTSSETASASDLGTESGSDTDDATETETSSAPDTGSNTDTGDSEDTGTGTSGTDTDTGSAVSLLTAEITAPDNGSLIEGGSAFTLRGIAIDSVYDESELTAVWKSNVSGILGTSTPDADGEVELANVTLGLGWHVITLEVENPKGQRAVDAVMVGSCEWSEPETFDQDFAGWVVFEDAYWNPEGWLEMTGIGQGKKGMIFRTDSTVDPGDVSISFSIRTGGGINGGADGFAMSVYNAQDVAELETIIATAGRGGCLGYGVDNGCGSPSDLQVEAFHVEIDTFHNTYSGGHPMQDPTSSNHIAVTLDGNPDNHVLWANTPSIEDQKWHDVTVDIVGIHVTVTLDGDVIIDGDVPQLNFRGGYIGFSGTTGWASNWHSFDNLHVQQGCVVPL